MRSARIHCCPGCGGPVAEGARRCGYCGSPIATVRCSRCYAMSSPEAAHCSGCGLGLGLEPVRESDAFTCPGCRVPFDAFHAGAGSLRDCNRCGGQFVDHALLRGLIERREVPVLYPNEQVVRTALRGMAAYQLSWFDAHLWAYAETSGLDELLSEDFQHDRLYGTVRVVNPFAGE